MVFFFRIARLLKFHQHSLNHLLSNDCKIKMRDKLDGLSSFFRRDVIQHE